MWSTFWHAFGLCVAAMFPIINPVGHAPMFYAMTEGDSDSYRRTMAWKAALYSTLILFAALFLGRQILAFFGVSLDDLRIAGGFLVATTALGMLRNSSKVTPDEHAAAQDKEDISLTPLATPILSGPGAMSLAIGLVSYGETMMDRAGYMAGFVAIGLMIWVCFLSAGRLVRLLGVNGAGALNRVLGLFIMAIGVDLMVEGIRHSFFPAP